MKYIFFTFIENITRYKIAALTQEVKKQNKNAVLINDNLYKVEYRSAINAEYEKNHKQLKFYLLRKCIVHKNL